MTRDSDSRRLCNGLLHFCGDPEFGILPQSVAKLHWIEHQLFLTKRAWAKPILRQAVAKFKARHIRGRDRAP
jgi:hypothetical protein